MAIALPPEAFNRLASGLATALARAADAGHTAAVVTSTRRRRFVRTVMAAKGLSSPVLSFDEIGLEARPALVGTVPR
jgi:flagellar biosynthesis protein FlhA